MKEVRRKNVIFSRVGLATASSERRLDFGVALPSLYCSPFLTLALSHFLSLPVSRRSTVVFPQFISRFFRSLQCSFSLKKKKLKKKTEEKRNQSLEKTHYRSAALSSAMEALTAGKKSKSERVSRQGKVVSAVRSFQCNLGQLPAGRRWSRLPMPGLPRTG